MVRTSVSRLLLASFVLGLVLVGAYACGKLRTEKSSTPVDSEAFSSPLTTVSVLPRQDSPLPEATLPPLVLEHGKGGARGQLADYPAEWRGKDLSVHFAPFSSTGAGQEGIFVLEPSVHPRTQVTPGGDFELGALPPGRYVVVVGPSPEQARPIEDAGRPVIFEITEGDVLEMGQVVLGR